MSLRREKISGRSGAFVVSLWLAVFAADLSAQLQRAQLIPVAKGWARNQINAVIFRRNSIVSHGDRQYIAFYDSAAKLVLAKRKLGTSVWQIRASSYTGDASDAHNSISIAVDGAGYLHVVWNQHDSRLQYCRSTAPGSLDLSSAVEMVGDKEDSVTYPEFYNLPRGDLLFLYRDGASGKGNLVLNRYDLRKQRWVRLQDRLISGENERSSYWQATVDQNGTIHLSWVWRETPDVASNHDVCYAKSSDGGKTWRKSSGEKYRLPITVKSAEYALHIPQQSGLINQTSMCADSRGRPYIATYWQAQGTGTPQYQLIYNDGRRWKTSQITRRTMSFTLRGFGTRRIPISRPQVFFYSTPRGSRVLVIFRDAERGDRVSVAASENLQNNVWTISDLTQTPVGMWEPTYDPTAWDKRKELHLFVQAVGQGEAEGVEEIPAQMIRVLEWRPR